MDAATALAAGARVVLAAVFAIAAVRKLRDGVPARVAAATPLFGAPAARALVVPLPFAELGVALALVAWWGSPVPGVVAALLLAAFTVVLVRAAARHVPCACFGQVPDTTAPGPAAIVRNGVLLALAVVATGA